MVLEPEVLEPQEWPGFATYLENVHILKESFSHPEIIRVPQLLNARGNSLARGARNQLSHVVYMDSELSVWLTES